MKLVVEVEVEVEAEHEQKSRYRYPGRFSTAQRTGKDHALMSASITYYVDELPLAAVGLCRRTISSTFAILAASCGLGAWGLGEREPNRIGLDAETRPLLPL